MKDRLNRVDEKVFNRLLFMYCFGCFLIWTPLIVHFGWWGLLFSTPAGLLALAAGMSRED